MNHRYGINRSAYTGRFPRTLVDIGWSSAFDPEPGLWRRLLALIAGH